MVAGGPQHFTRRVRMCLFVSVGEEGLKLTSRLLFWRTKLYALYVQLFILYILQIMLITCINLSDLRPIIQSATLAI